MPPPRIEAAATLESVLRIMAGASSFEESDRHLNRSNDANFAARDASNLIRGDLGLPSSPTCEEINADESRGCLGDGHPGAPGGDRRPRASLLDDSA